MDELVNFYEYLKTKVPASAKKYEGAVRTTFNEMKSFGVIDKSLGDMSILEINTAIEKILKNDRFIEKNERGKSMYSCALKWYKKFLFEMQ